MAGRLPGVWERAVRSFTAGPEGGGRNNAPHNARRGRGRTWGRHSAKVAAQLPRGRGGRPGLGGEWCAGAGPQVAYAARRRRDRKGPFHDAGGEASVPCRGVQDAGVGAVWRVYVFGRASAPVGGLLVRCRKGWFVISWPNGAQQAWEIRNKRRAGFFVLEAGKNG